MDIQHMIYNEVREMRSDFTVQLRDLSTRVTAVEIELRTQGKKVSEINGCVQRLDEDVDELTDFAENTNKRRWSRTDKMKIIGISLSAVFALAALVVSVVVH